MEGYPLYIKRREQLNFPRDKYYSQTELLKKFKITSKELKALNLPYIKKEIDLGTYSVQAKYFPKEVVHELDLPLRG